MGVEDYNPFEKQQPTQPLNQEQGQDNKINEENSEINAKEEYTIPNTKQIEEAEQGITAESKDDKKIAVVSKAIMDSYLRDVDGMVKKMDQRVSGKAESINICESLENQLAITVKDKMQEELYNTLDNSKYREHMGYKSDSLIVKLAGSIRQDVFRGPNQSMKIPESIDRTVSSMIVAYIHEKEKFTVQELKETERALYLASLYGQYKFFKWQRSDQIKQVTSIQEELIKKNSDFNLARAGFFETKTALENEMAGIKLDLNSKPNYQYAHPEYRLKNNDCAELLISMSRVEASHFLKDHDILPKDDT